MQQRTFHVPDIHCDECRSSIHRALDDIDGIKQVTADIATNSVGVRYDERRVNDQRIVALLDKRGFPVQSITTAGEPTGRGDTGGKPWAQGDRSAGARYALLAVAVGVIGVAGYAGYVLYPRFDLPAAEGAALLGLAAAAGIASFFSPCSFPLLLGLLGRQVAPARDKRCSTRPMLFAAALASGAAVFMLLLGGIIGVGGTALLANVTFASAAGIILRSAVGVVLILLGLVQLAVLPSPMLAVERLSGPITRSQARLRRDKPVAGFALFGFGYVLAGFG